MHRCKQVQCCAQYVTTMPKAAAAPQLPTAECHCTGGMQTCRFLLCVGEWCLGDTARSASHAAAWFRPATGASGAGTCCGLCTTTRSSTGSCSSARRCAGRRTRQRCSRGLTGPSRCAAHCCCSLQFAAVLACFQADTGTGLLYQSTMLQMHHVR